LLTLFILFFIAFMEAIKHTSYIWILGFDSYRKALPMHPTDIIR